MRRPLIVLCVMLSGACARPRYGSHVRFVPEADDAPAPTDTLAEPVAHATGAEVDVYALKAAVDAGNARVIDVRTPEEFATGHVPGARNIPLDLLSLESVATDPGQDLYVVCRSGRRSAEASARLHAWGAAPRDVSGGTDAWIAAGFPVE